MKGERYLLATRAFPPYGRGANRAYFVGPFANTRAAKAAIKRLPDTANVQVGDRVAPGPLQTAVRVSPAPLSYAEACSAGLRTGPLGTENNTLLGTTIPVDTAAIEACYSASGRPFEELAV